MGAITPRHVLDELADIAFAVPGEEGGPPVKVADKLRALELLYKHLGLGEGAGGEAVTIIDDVRAPPRTSREEGEDPSRSD